MFDGQKFGAEVVGLVKDFVQRELAPIAAENAALREKVTALEARELPAPGLDEAAVRSLVGEALAAIELPAPVIDGDALSERVSAAVEAQIAALPAPKDGESVDPETVWAMVDAAVAERMPEAGDVAIALTATEDAPLLLAVRAQVDTRIAEIPAPQDGVSVDPETVEALVSEKVAAGLAALPAPLSVRGTLIGRDGNLVVTYSDGSTADLGPVLGRDADEAALRKRIDDWLAAVPAPKDGAPGATFTLDDFDIVPRDDGRTIEMKFTQGDVTHAFELCFPVMIYRDVYKEGETYQHGDCVTFGGSLWHAQKETAERPGPGDAWRLAVRRGRDGKDLKSGIVAEQVRIEPT